jgi:DNA-binding NarL/FixJ family response regulator
MQKGVACLDHVLPPRDKYSERPVLTEKEMEVLEMLAKGLTNKEIGDNCFRSRAAIRTRIRGMLLKFGASNRTELVACAFRSGAIR